VTYDSRAASRPNILFLQSDHHTGYALGSEPEGRPPVKTPVLDRMAGEGISFGENRCTTPMCAPSRAAMMSATYAHSNGMWNNNHTPAAMRRDVYPDVRLWSQNLRDAGYRLRYTGKWHVSDVRSPSAFGWEEPDTPGGGRQPRRAEAGWPYRPRPREIRLDQPRGAGGNRGNAPGARLYPHREGWPDRVMCGTSTTPPEETRDGLLTQRAIQLIEEQAGWPEPWCLYVGWSNPHDPYVANERYVRQYDVRDIPRPPSFGDDLSDKPGIYRKVREQLWAGLPWDDVAQMILHYCAMITFLDEQIGLLLDALERTGQAENTIVLYTSDHGDYAGAHGLFTKSIPAFDEAYRVPLLMRWPAGIAQPGQRVDAFTSLIDVGPTLLEAAGAQPLPDVHGRSLAPFLRGEMPVAWPDQFVGEFMGHETFMTQRVVRTKTHKYVWNGFDFDELYDLQRDPYETTNLQADPAYEGVKRDLVARLWRWAGETDDIINNGYPFNATLPYGPGIAAD
jgi:arylsulfatase A-like enzyme